uniref:Pleckstrin homology domain containing A6 n=1 Tax=Myripristis murdjan TaxID=586833 RepID=A0A667ZJF5_9TELE
MNGKVEGRPVSTTTTDVNSNSANMVSELSPEVQPYTRSSRTSRKAALFGKRSNSMRRNPKAEVTKQGWLYNSGVQFDSPISHILLFPDEKEDTVLGSLPLLSFQIGGVQPSDNITRKFCFKAEHAGTRTYYFSADSHEEQEEWIRVMNDAAQVNIHPAQSHTHHSNNHPNGWGSYDPPNGLPHNSNPPPTRSYSGDCPPQVHPEGGVGPPRDSREQLENVVLRRGFVPRTAPERLAQRKSSMTQLQQWVNQRRGMASQEDMSSPSRYYTVNRGVSADYYGVYSSRPQYVEEYPLYPPGVRPDSICSVSAVGGYDRRWTIEEKRRSLRDGPLPIYGLPMPRDLWGSQYYSGSPIEMAQTSMRRLSIQPRSRSVPRSPSSSSGGPYSPGPPNFASPARSPSVRFDQFPGGMREDVIYADPSVYGLRRSLSSPKKLLGRLCEQNRFLKDQEAVVHRLRMEKDSLEGALVATHQEMELYRNQPRTMEKLQFKKETLQNQLINIRGELSQASSALTTTRMEFEALEDEANAIHGDLWEQLNAGGQSEMVHRHIQKEFWRVQDVLEGLHKNNSSRGTDTAKHRVASGASGSFSTNSPASPLSSVSLTSPLSPFSPVPGSQASPTKQLGVEVSTRHTQPGANPNLNPEQQIGIVPPRTKSPTDDPDHSYDGVSRRNGKMPNGISRERPKSAVFPAEVKSKMTVEEQNARIRRNQSSSVRDKRRSLNLSGGTSAANYKVVRRRLTAHEVDIKDLEAAVRGEGVESPREEIARLRRLQIEPDHYDLDISKELMAPNKVVIPERYVDTEENTPLSPEEQKEKQKKVERIKTLIAKSNMQNVVPLLDGPVEGGSQVNSEQQLQEQEKRIEISCALAAEASRRSRLLSGLPRWSFPRPHPPAPPGGSQGVSRPAGRYRALSCARLPKPAICGFRI